MTKTSIAEKTIQDFGDQWTHFASNDGFYGSRELFEDIVGPSLTPDELSGKTVLDIGSGTGRIVAMLVSAGVDHVTAVEPSDAFEVLTKNAALIKEKTGKDITCIRVEGHQIDFSNQFDAAVSIGVLHHIPEPVPVVKKVYDSLVAGGKFVAWLYGKEGNRTYLFFIEQIRKITQHLPHFALMGIVWILYLILCIYRHMCRVVSLPLSDYIRNVLFRMAPEKRRLVIYDQLNPAYAKYYTKSEATDLLRRGGFSDVSVYSRRGYSWIVVGKK